MATRWWVRETGGTVWHRFARRDVDDTWVACCGATASDDGDSHECGTDGGSVPAHSSTVLMPDGPGDALCPKCAAVLRMSAEGNDDADIAEAVGTSPGTVRSRLFYARKELRARLSA